MLLVVEVKTCKEVSIGETAIEDGFTRYYFRREEMLSLYERPVKERQRIHGDEGSSTAATLAAILVFSRAGWDRGAINKVRRHYEQSPGPAVNLESTAGFSSGILFDQDLLWAQAGNSKELPEEIADVTAALIEKLERALPVSKKRHIGLDQQLAREMGGTR